MKTIFTACSLLVLSVLAGYAQTPTPTATPVTAAAPFEKLKVGDTAPDFTLTDTTGQKVKLSEFRGKNNVVLAFYVFAFTGG